MEHHSENTSVRKIIHIDMDAFYASIEQLDFPQLKGKAIAVGNSERGGVVTAASYEARPFGVHSAMPSVIARKKCPHLIFQRPRFDRYKAVSKQLMQIFKSYTEMVEPLSLDEAYLDVTYNKKELKSAIKIAMLLREEIKEKTHLTASAGVSFNKFLAKTASDLKKPDGLAVILPDEAIDFMKTLEIEKFHGIGKVTAKKMHEMGISNGNDLMQYSRKSLIQHFGKSGKHYHDIVTANDQRAVKPNRIRKSIGVEQTYANGLNGLEEFIEELKVILDKLILRINHNRRKGKTITLKIKFQDFEQKTRSKTLDHFTNEAEIIWETCMELLQNVSTKGRAVRLLGISMTQLDLKAEQKNNQLTLAF